MKKIIFFLILGIFLLPLTSWANVFELYAIKKVPGAFYFTPAVSSKEFAIFGYMSKITPTPEELEAERKRINRIIDEGIKEEYGSWENFEKKMRKTGEQTAQKESKEAPSWVKILLPPSLIKEAVPLLMKGALLYAKAHPEASREPIGNVGETGVIVVDKWGNIIKIHLGINAPVESIAVSHDGKLVAALTDLSFEDKNGNLHPMGEISLIDLNAKTRIYSHIFANLAGHIAFVPGLPSGTYWLAFDYYTDMKNFGKQDVGFLDLRSKRILKYRFHTLGNGSASIYGKNVDYPSFVLGIDPKSHTPIIALHKQGIFEIYNVMTGKKLLKVLDSYTLAFAHNHPWIFTDFGEWWNYKTGQLLGKVKIAKISPAIGVKFINNDRDIIYVEPFACPKLFDIRAKRIVKSGDFYSKAGLFFLTPDERFMVTFYETNKMVSYKGYLKRAQLCLNIIDTQDLRLRQKICFKNSSVVDTAMAGDTMIVSDFDKIYVFKPF